MAQKKAKKKDEQIQLIDVGLILNGKEWEGLLDIEKKYKKNGIADSAFRASFSIEMLNLEIDRYVKSLSNDVSYLKSIRNKLLKYNSKNGGKDAKKEKKEKN